ncbi:MAG: M23 family metallopeptidase [Pseudomonadota bacterium]|nr:M23 family metallopeptidase [Pseudomonadota bacterium]
MYQFNDMHVGAGGGTAALSLNRVLVRPTPQPSLSERVQLLRARADQVDLVTDLGQRIGSRQWLRGFATCAFLCYAAFALAPALEPIAGASPAPLGDAQWEEARALSFTPLAYGADTGRRMAATEAVEPLTGTPERPSIDLVASLGQGDGFVRVLERAGVGSSEAEQVAHMIGAVVPLTDIRPGTAMELTLGRRPNARVSRPLDSLSFRARFDLKLSLQRMDGKLTIARIPISVDNTPLRIQGRVGSSLYRSARAAGAPAKAVEAFIRAVATQLNIGSIDADDQFDIILEHRRAETGDSETGQLLYAGLDRSDGKDLQLMQWNEGGKLQWFEAAGVGKARGLLQRPVPGMVSSNFGLRRHPILGYTRMHKGMDFRAGYGTPILAATDGRVAAAGWAGGYGRQVRISHPGGLLTSYSHMSRIVAQPGSVVRQGQVIGYVGSTGLSTGPHLHYELYRNGVPINPASVQFVMRSQLSGASLANFRARLRSLLSVPIGAQQQASAAAAAPRGGQT